MNYGYTPYPQLYRTPYGQTQMPQAQPMVPHPVSQTTVQPPMVQAQQPGYICRPVASEEEARAVPTDFSGATQILVDAAHGMIYAKGLNYNDGSAVFLAYKLVQPAGETQRPVSPAVEYAPMSAVDRLREELDDLKASLTERKQIGRKAASDQ